MTNKLFISTAIVIGGIVITGYSFTQSLTSPVVLGKQKQQIQVTIQPPGPVDNELYQIHFHNSGIDCGRDKALLKGVIVPHHLLAGELIARGVGCLRNRELTTIVLITPNHFERGQAMIVSGLGSWSTDFGLVETNVDFLLSLEAVNLVKFDDEALYQEHAIRDLMPYLAYYLPNVTVAPIMLSGYIDKEETKKLADNLLAIAQLDSTAIIASIDFSHYLDAYSAQKNDALTLELIRQRNVGQIWRLSNDYVDSPASLIAMLTIMDQVSAFEIDVWANTNSGFMLRKPYTETTSYFLIGFNED
jgi:MEMO1 family protein